MKSRTAGLVLVALGLTSAGVTPPVAAHHSYAIFDMDTVITYEGVIVEYNWRSPHVHIIVDIAPGEGVPDGHVGTWDVEGASTAIMTRQGWNRATLNAGDPITYVGRPLRDGGKGTALFYVIRPDGSCLYMDIARPKEPDPRCSNND
jgi:hypothetical protein